MLENINHHEQIVNVVYFRKYFQGVPDIDIAVYQFLEIGHVGLIGFDPVDPPLPVIVFVSPVP